MMRDTARNVLLLSLPTQPDVRCLRHQARRMLSVPTDRRRERSDGECKLRPEFTISSDERKEKLRRSMPGSGTAKRL